MSASLESDGDRVDAGIMKLIDSFDFTRQGVDGSLGRDLAMTVVLGINGRSVPDCIAPDNSIWLSNEPGYAARKAQRYGATQPNVRTWQMLSPRSLLGGTVISAELVEMKYGTGQPPAEAKSGEIAAADTTITDIEKAHFCSQTRAFYGLDSTIAGACRDTVAQALEKAAGEL